MADTYFTLEYAGLEKTFQAWGFTNPKMQPRSQAASTFTVLVPGVANLIAAPPIPFAGAVKIRRYLNGGGAQLIFQGKQTTDKRSASQSPANTLIFSDGWWDLENITFQHYWKRNSGGGVTNQYFSRVNLFQSFTTPWNYINNGVQITEIIQYAITCGANLQVGTIDPATPLPIYPVRGMKCATALQLCLKPQPDAVMWIDGSTTPPTFNCRLRANLAALALPYADGVKHVSSEIVPRPDLKPSSVVLQYQITNMIGATTWVDFENDVWPAGATGQEIRALVCPIDLRGVQQNQILVSTAALDPTSLAWWKKKKHDLGSANISGLALVDGSIKVVDDAGSDITSSWGGNWPNEYLRGEICGWMKDGGGHAIVAKQVTVTGSFIYDKLDQSGTPQTVHKIGANDPHEISARIKITNSPAGDANYLQHFDAGEVVITGLAHSIFDSLNWDQFEGTHLIVERNAKGAAEVGTIVGPQYALNLTGGQASWATMLATIQSVDIDFFHGTTEVSFGPPKHIAPGDLIEVLEWLRWRSIVDQPALRTSGNESDGGSQLGGDTAAENTTQGLPAPELHTVAADAGGGTTTRIQHDAINEKIIMQRVDSGDGSDIAGHPSLLLKLADITTGNKVLKVLEFQWRDAATCAMKKACFVMTEPEAA